MRIFSLDQSLNHMSLYSLENLFLLGFEIGNFFKFCLLVVLKAVHMMNFFVAFVQVFCLCSCFLTSINELKFCFHSNEKRLFLGCLVSLISQ